LKEVANAGVHHGDMVRTVHRWLYRGLIIGEIALLVVLAFVRIGEPSRQLSSIEPEGFPDLVPSLQKQDALV
jgi:hypothetical protein